jgi:hypothetical protein
MDEKGFMKGIGDDVKVSVIECVGTNGYSLPPFVIFQGQRIQESWVNIQMDTNRPSSASLRMAGWIGTYIALDCNPAPIFRSIGLELHHLQALLMKMGVCNAAPG